MSDINIDVNELITSLNGQVASYNLELAIAKLQISALQKEIRRLQETSVTQSSENFVTPEIKTKSKN